MAVTDTFVTPSAPGSWESCQSNLQVGDGVALDMDQSVPAQAGPGCDPCPNFRPCDQSTESIRTSEQLNCASTAGKRNIAITDGRAIPSLNRRETRDLPPQPAFKMFLSQFF